MKILHVFTTSSHIPHIYHIAKENKFEYLLKEKTLLDEPLRFNIIDNRVEYFNGTYWDVWISDEEILEIGLE